MGTVPSGDIVSSEEVEGGVVEMVKDFTYLGSTWSADGETAREVDCRIARASKAFGSLRLSIFTNSALSVGTKRTTYNVVIIFILLYGAETWTLKAPDVRRLTVFTIVVFVQFWEYHGLGSGKSVLPPNIYQFSLECPGRLLVTFWSEGSVAKSLGSYG